MPEIKGANRGANVHRSRRSMVLRKLFPNSVSVTLRTKRPKASWRLLAVVVFGLLMVVALALVGVIMSGRGGSEQSSSEGPVATVPSPGNTSYEAHSVIPTNRWMNFYGLESTLDGQPLSVGAVITARDSQGVVCGEFVVTHIGRYGIMPVYGDDPLTEADEGAGPGDPLQFYVDGIKAAVIGPDEPVWTAMGDLKQVNLQASTTH